MTWLMDSGFTDISGGEILLRLSIATLLGALLGIEREAREKPAGIRTYALVALGSASFMLTGLYIVDQAADGGQMRMDLIRVVAGIIGGVGFLGAGAIIQSRGSIHGLTTAAGIWLIAAVGLACGAGGYFIALTTVVLAYVALIILHLLKCRLHHVPAHHPADDDA